MISAISRLRGATLAPRISNCRSNQGNTRATFYLVRIRHPMPKDTMRTLVDLLQQQAERYQNKVAFSFSYHGDDEGGSQLTYRELDTRARAIAAQLQQRGAAGQRVLVFCATGLDGIAGYFGCLYAGAVAVPVHQRMTPQLASVVADAQADFALAPSSTQADVRAAVDLLADGRPLRWLALDEIADDPGAWVAPDIDADTTAMILYSWGATRSPNGVVLTHHNLMHNLAGIHQTWPGDEHETAVSWLSPHHDMGLVIGILQMLYVGGTTVLMSSSAFFLHPMRWLEAMSRHRSTLTIAPNFAYDLCVEHSTPQQRAALDLSHWRAAITGAEPVQARTMRAFTEAFAPAGFRSEVFMPIYGLKEATLLVSGGPAHTVPVVHHIDGVALDKGRVAVAAPDRPGAVEVVGCGRPCGGQQVIVVDPQTRQRCGTAEVGELWIAGHSVGQGYWGKPAETEQTFAAFLSDTGAGPFLRTGDLGFLCGGELFIIGRRRDAISSALDSLARSWSRASAPSA